jgi:hypothetical protein
MYNNIIISSIISADVERITKSSGGSTTDLEEALRKKRQLLEMTIPEQEAEAKKKKQKWSFPALPAADI